jgi:O-antigen/teichoic acid export membrane protein
MNMRMHYRTLTKGAIWTFGAFGIIQVTRFITNVVLTRLLAPELFGIMVIVNTLKTGVELLSDIGIGQSIVYHKLADRPDFYNTAWTLQGLRGILLWIFACGASPFFAYFYQAHSLLIIIPISSTVLILAGFHSVAQFILKRRLEIGRLSIYEAACVIIWAAGQIAIAYVWPNIWALVFGLIFGSATSLIGSFFLAPGIKSRFIISRQYAGDILHFGKWIFLSSAVFFLASSFDRLFFARVIPLALLGVYGISRSISDLFSSLAVRISNTIVFPFVAQNALLPRQQLQRELSPPRVIFLLISAVTFAALASSVDLAIKFVFDERYREASWIVPILILGGWLSTLSSLSESTLLGIGRPHYTGIANTLKFLWLAVALPVSFLTVGLTASIFVIAASDLFRYFYLALGQYKERISLVLQDVMATIFMIALLCMLEWARWSVGLGTSFDGISSKLY